MQNQAQEPIKYTTLEDHTQRRALSSESSNYEGSSSGSEGRRLSKRSRGSGSGSRSECENELVARCDLADPTNETGVFGAIFFRQCAGKELFVGAYVGGLTEGSHGFHVHTDGITGGACSSAGGHYNPTGVTHSSWDADSRHDGDLQSLVSKDPRDFTLLEYYDP